VLLSLEIPKPAEAETASNVEGVTREAVAP
jgi:hypothetical protein